MTEEQARTIYQQGEDAVVWAFLKMSGKLAALSPARPAPTAPSGVIPPYQQPPAGKSRKKKPGAKPGHKGCRRPTPERIDRREKHRLSCCPHCEGRLKRCDQTRTRIIEDIPEGITPVVTEHTIHRDWCPKCHKFVEPKVPDALPNSTLGHRTTVMSSWLHYGLGNTLSQIVEVFNYHLQLKLSTGGLLRMWRRLQDALFPWYEQIRQEALASAVLHGDETSWRVGGKTYWLWTFATNDLTFYMIDRSRGEPALRKFFEEEFQGVLVSDFWAPYNAILCAAKQKCLPHLLRDMHAVNHYGKGGSDWPEFYKKLRRLIGDAIRLGGDKEKLPAENFASRRQRLTERLDEIIATEWTDRQSRRLVKRLQRHRDELFTFLDKPGVPFDNNLAERAVRPAVVIRKNSNANRSEQGAEIQAVLMTLYRTLKQRGHNALQTITNALRTYVKTGVLPPLPQKATPDG